MKSFNTLLVGIFLGLSAISFAAAPDNPPFDLLNKSKNVVYITVINGANKVLEKVAIPVIGSSDNGKNIPGSVQIDISKPTELRIYPAQNDAKYYAALFNPGKTIYLTFDADDKSVYLRPQTGTLMGFSGSTRKGYSLKNNVSENDVIAALAAAKKLPQEPGVKPDQTQPLQPSADAKGVSDLLQKLQATTVKEAIEDLKELESVAEKLKQNLGVKPIYESFTNALNSTTLQNALAKINSFDTAAMQQLNDLLVNAIFEGKTQLFEALLVLKKQANPLIATLSQIVKAKNSQKSAQEVIALIPNEIPVAPSIDKMTKQQLKEAVDSIKIEPPLTAQSSTNSAPQAKSSALITPPDLNLLPQLLEILGARTAQEALANLNALEQRVQTVKNKLKVTYISLANTLNSPEIKKQLENIKDITDADKKKFAQSLVDAIFDLKKQLFEAQMLLKKHANPLIAKVIELQKAKASKQTPEAIMALIPTEIPAPPSIESMSKQQLLDALKALKLEPFGATPSR